MQGSGTGSWAGFGLPKAAGNKASFDPSQRRGFQHRNASPLARVKRVPGNAPHVPSPPRRGRRGPQAGGGGDLAYNVMNQKSDNNRAPPHPSPLPSRGKRVKVENQLRGEWGPSHCLRAESAGGWRRPHWGRCRWSTRADAKRLQVQLLPFK